VLAIVPQRDTQRDINAHTFFRFLE